MVSELTTIWFISIDNCSPYKNFASKHYEYGFYFYMFTAVSDESKLALLELLCFFNENEDLAEELVEERWFAQSSNEKQILKKTWKYVLSDLFFTVLLDDRYCL